MRERIFSKNNLLYYISVLLVICTLCTSCISVKSSNQSNTTQNTTDNHSNANNSKEKTLSQKQFDDFLTSFFKETLSESVLTVHSVLASPKDYGIDSYEYDLGDISREASTEFCNSIQGQINQLKEFEYDFLTDEQKLIYDIMLTDFEDTLELEGYYLFHDYLSPLKGTPSYMPSYLGQFSFHSSDDVTDYLKILKQLPDYYDKIIAFEKEKADAGMCMPDFELDKVIDQCKEFIQNPDTNFLITTFTEKINALTDLSERDKQTYILIHKDLVKNSLIPAYQKLMTEASALKGKAVTEGGLCSYPDGSKYYEALVRSCTNTDKSVLEIKKLLTEKLQTDLTTLIKLSDTNPDLYESSSNYPIDTSNPDTILHYLIQKIGTDFPSGFETSYTLNDVPKALEKYQSPAYYFIPQIDNLSVNNIYINRHEDYADMDLYPVLAHEGFPGHMYQTTYFQNTNPHPVRSLFRYSGYLEGWGLYAELYSYELSGQDADIVTFNQTINCISYDICCLADIGIHYDGWTRADTIQFVSSLGYDEAAGNSIYEALIEDPCSYLTYYIGYLEIMEMRETARLELGDKFNIQAFHKFILDIGPAQFEIIRERFTIWLDNQK
ncbi:MAG: DUF885 domain-containing protein [Lachnospiraceae bacterium]|nr:DUF885 domain-containing protein [Lachnospiraceae bacterium]